MMKLSNSDDSLLPTLPIPVGNFPLQASGERGLWQNLAEQKS